MGSPEALVFASSNAAELATSRQGLPDSPRLERRAVAERRLGSVLDDKWRLDRILAAGGKAVVYAATDENGALAAIKYLPFDPTTSPASCLRFLRESQLAKQVNHPRVVRPLEERVDYDRQHAYLVMELLEGETVRDRIVRDGPFRPSDAVHHAVELCDALSSVHRENIVHRDITPTNLFLTPDGLKLLDFGTAHRLDGADTAHDSHSPLGTPGYMSPEQARGARNITPKSDIYSVGATLLFMVSGETLHRADSARELVALTARTQAPPALESAPGLPPELCRIIDICCSFEPRDRYPDIDALRRELAGFEPR